jgi:hypothetical protein
MILLSYFVMNGFLAGGELSGERLTLILFGCIAPTNLMAPSLTMPASENGAERLTTPGKNAALGPKRCFAQMHV